MVLFLGVDGGSSKTSAVITDESGRVLFKARGGGSNYYALGAKKAEHNLYKLISSLLKKRELKLAGACFGIAGIDSEREYNIVHSSIKQGLSKLIKCKFILVNDVNLILPAINCENGVAAVGGTGSNFYAINGKKEARASGMGHILADEGGAIYLGNRVLRAAVQSFDDRGKKTVLEKLVIKKAGVKNIRELKGMISDVGHVESVADFAPLAEKAADMGDGIAKKILDKAAEEQVKGIRAVARRVGLKNPVIGFAGSTFKVKYLFDGIKRRVREFAPHAKFYIVKNSAVGAARLAIKKFWK